MYERILRYKYGNGVQRQHHPEYLSSAFNKWACRHVLRKRRCEMGVAEQTKNRADQRQRKHPVRFCHLEGLPHLDPLIRLNHRHGVFFKLNSQNRRVDE